MRRNRLCSADAAVCIISRLLGGLQRQQAPQCGAPSTRAPPRHLPTARSLPGVQEFEIIQSVRLSVHLPASPQPGLALLEMAESVHVSASNGRCFDAAQSTATIRCEMLV